MLGYSQSPSTVILELRSDSHRHYWRKRDQMRDDLNPKDSNEVICMPLINGYHMQSCHLIWPLLLLTAQYKYRIKPVFPSLAIQADKRWNQPLAEFRLQAADSELWLISREAMARPREHSWHSQRTERPWEQYVPDSLSCWDTSTRSFSLGTTIICLQVKFFFLLPR